MTRDENHQQYVGDTTKTRRSRLIAIPTGAVEALLAWRRIQVERRLAYPAWQQDDIDFDRGDGRFVPDATFQDQHWKVVAKARVRHLNPHSIRHTYATLGL